MINNKLKIAVTQVPPFIMESNGEYSGFEIELWEAIAKEIGVSFEYEKHNFQKLIPLVADKKVDIALGAITINKEREEIVDFSHPIFNSGLRILLSKNRTKIDVGNTIKSFLTQGWKQLIKPLLILLVIILIFGNMMWFAERGVGVASSYFPGVIKGIWLSVFTIIGSPNAVGPAFYNVRTLIGKLTLIFGQLLNLVVLGIIIGEIAAFITTRKIRLNIEGPNDLRGKIVATVQSTTSESLLKKLGAIVVPVIKIEEAYEQLKKNEVEAVVFDAPILIYYMLNEGTGWTEVVGELFDKQDYGIGLQTQSPLRERINRAILTIKESGYYNTLYKKWFGEAE